jgi:hypothetical protein
MLAIYRYSIGLLATSVICLLWSENMAQLEVENGDVNNVNKYIVVVLCLVCGVPTTPRKIIIATREISITY